MRRKGQITAEYALLIAVFILVVGVGAFTSMFGTTSKHIANSSPEYKEKIISRNANDVLNKDGNEFIKQYNILNDDPSAKSCTDTLTGVLSSLENIETGKASDQDMLNALEAIAEADTLGLENASAKNMVGNACNSLSGSSADAMNKINSILNNDIVTINYAEATCAGKCTITTSSNGLLQDLIPQFESNKIPSSVLSEDTSKQDVKSIFENYYYVGADTPNPGKNYMKSIALLNYLNNNNYLSSDSKDKYTSLVTEVKNAIYTYSSEDDSSDLSYHPDWESVPIPIGGSASSDDSSSGNDSSDDSSDPSSSPPAYYFCD